MFNFGRARCKLFKNSKPNFKVSNCRIRFFSTVWTEPPLRANLLLGEPPSRGLLYVYHIILYSSNGHRVAGFLSFCGSPTGSPWDAVEASKLSSSINYTN